MKTITQSQHVNDTDYVKVNCSSDTTVCLIFAKVNSDQNFFWDRAAAKEYSVHILLTISWRIKSPITTKKS